MKHSKMDMSKALENIFKKNQDGALNITIAMGKPEVELEDEKDKNPDLAPESESMEAIDEKPASEQQLDQSALIQKLLAGGDDHSPQGTLESRARMKMKEKLAMLKK